LILGNIFFGVIVDTFNEFRDLKDQKTEDEKNRCFMCNRHRYDSNFNDNFDKHRDYNHRIFNYVYFIPYLLKKNPQQFSRAEAFVWQQLNLKKLDWFPSRIQEENKY